MDNKELKENSEFTVEEGIARLDEILLAMEAEGVELESSFALYEEGMGLLKTVNEKIDQVEKKVMILSGESEIKAFDDDFTD